MKRPFFNLCAGMIGCALAWQVPSTAIARGQETVLHAFGDGTDGWEPNSGVIDVKGILYGTTEQGGANTGCGSSGCGTVFALDPSTDTETVLYSFCSKFNKSRCEDGSLPTGNLIDVKGRLYGETADGGANDLGTVFAFDRKTAGRRCFIPFAASRIARTASSPSRV